MCDQDLLDDMASKGVSRRQFAALGAATGLAACAPMDAGSAPAGLTEGMVSFPAPGGTMDAFFVHPASGKHPAVIVWPDIAGLRDAFKMIGRDLAAQGYSVLVVNPFYRSAPAPQFADFDDWRTNGGMQKVGPWMAQNSHAAITETAKALVAWLDKQPAVDTRRGIGNQGYCMGGPFTVRTAAAVPSRVKAAASFHGGGLVGTDPTAPINLLDDTQAQFLFAIARNDDAKAPAEKDQLRAAAAAAGRPAEIEVYDGDHGWTVMDSPSWAEPAAKKALERLHALYKRAL
ncbi:MAG: dienelactone hydrolase family protein [Croceibacterium sp.]